MLRLCDNYFATGFYANQGKFSKKCDKPCVAFFGELTLVS